MPLSRLIHTDFDCELLFFISERCLEITIYLIGQLGTLPPPFATDCDSGVIQGSVFDQLLICLFFKEISHLYFFIHSPKYHIHSPKYQIHTPKYHIHSPKYQILTPKYHLHAPKYQITFPNIRYNSQMSDTPSQISDTPSQILNTRTFEIHCKIHFKN
jgi:hypothetical protein